MPGIWIDRYSVEFGGIGLIKATVLDVFPKTLIYCCLHRLVIKSLVNGSAHRLILFSLLI